MRAKRGRPTKIALGILLALWIGTMTVSYFSRHPVPVLDPAGTIARQERNLIFLALGLCAIVVIPVFALAIMIPMRYREGSKRRGKYSPNWDGSRWLEATWWAVPFAIITTLAIVTWKTSYSLDPYKSLASNTKPLNVEVVALDWKWLFIYPDQKIATVNTLELPVNTPLNFHITSDSVMNSFWIPNLGGQIYAMPSMDTQLHLMADKAGSYRGSSANISGQGFASMNFKATVGSAGEFKNWVNAARLSDQSLTKNMYESLSLPSQNNSPTTYRLADSGLYNQVIDTYAAPGMKMIGGMH